MLEPGSNLGPYQIHSEIGRGGMAIVYRARQPSMERDVAIKVITKDLSGDPEAGQRFQREARLIARLEHPHILPVYDFDGRATPPYLVMRYLNGGPLKNILGEQPLPLNEISHLFRQIGSALDYAHRQGIVHRDIKPSNIMIDQDGNAFVTDFGIARLIGRRKQFQQRSDGPITLTGAAVGTPDYMSPEQIKDASSIDHRADIYALGVMLFQLLTGQLPFSSKSQMDIYLAHLQKTPPAATDLNPDLPPAIEPVLTRALAKEPADRYGTVQEMIEEISGALGGQTTAAPAQLRAIAAAVSQQSAGASAAGSGSTVLTEQNKVVTVLAVNASEYSEIIAAEAGSEAAQKALAAFWETAQASIAEHEGLVISQTGESLQAIWGAIAASENDSERAIRAALAIRENMAGQSAALLQEGELLPLKIGLHTGIALLTPTDNNQKFTATGSVISLANRLMQETDGAIRITHHTYSQVRGVFSLAPDLPLRLRRGQGEIATYRVIRAKPRAFRVNSRGIEGIETRMIGREAELKTLQNAFLDAVEESETQMISLISRAGLGKSRLLYEFNNWSELRPQTYWLLQGRATPEMSGRPYALWRDILSNRCEIQDNDPAAVVKQKLEKAIDAHVGPAATIDRQEMAHLLGHLAGFELGDSPYIDPLRSDPAQLTARGKVLFQEWMAALCTTADAVVVQLEDLHYSDAPTLDLLTELMTWRDNLPLLIIGLARPLLLEKRPDWGSGQSGHTLLELRPLDKRDSRALTRELLQKAAHIPKQLQDLLVERAEGNPYYLEELVKMLIDDHIIQKESEERWQIAKERLAQLTAPPTLFGLLQARLDSLLPAEKLVLQRAAVVGRIFYDTALQALDQADDYHISDLPAILQRLTEREFILRRETTALVGSVEYIFASALLREALLATLLRRQVKSYNRAAAEWLEQASGARMGEYQALIAGYYEQAGEAELAARHLRPAVAQALAANAYNEARQLAERALRLLPEQHPDRPELALQLGEANYQLGHYPAARTALAIAQEQGTTRQIVPAHRWLIDMARDEGDYAAAQEALQTALPAARQLDDPQLLAEILLAQASLAWTLGDFAAAETAVREGILLAGKADAAPLEMRSANLLANILNSQGQTTQAQQRYEAILAQAQQINHRGMIVTALSNLGELADLQGDVAQAQRYTEQALRLAREIGVQQSIAVSLANLARIKIRAGDLTSVAADICEGLTVARRIGTLPILLSVIQNAGYLLYQQGQREQGLALLGLGQTHPAANSENKREVAHILDLLDLSADEPAVVEKLAAGGDADLDKTAAELLLKLA